MKIEGVLHFQNTLDKISHKTVLAVETQESGRLLKITPKHQLQFEK